MNMNENNDFDFIIVNTEYDYVKREFFEIINLNKNEVANYEDKSEDPNYEENYYPENTLER